MGAQMKLSLDEMLEEIMCPLREVGISYFGFDRAHLNKPTIRITNRADWLGAFLANNFEKISPFERDPRTYVAGKVLWRELQQDPIYKMAAQDFGIAHGITLIHPSYRACEFYHFATSPENAEITKFYLSDASFLDNFITVFKIKIAVYLKDFFQSYATADCGDTFLENKGAGELALFDDIRRYYFNYEGIEGYLTKGEVGIIRLLRQGKTTSEIVSILNFSERTYESHIKSIKGKFGCKSLFELGFRLAKLDLHNVVY